MGTLNHTCHNPNCPNKKVDKDGKLLPNYYACDTCDKANGITWRALCCSRECFVEYMELVAKQRKQAQEKVKAKAKTKTGTETDVRVEAETEVVTDEPTTVSSEVVAHVAAKSRKRKKPVESVEEITTEAEAVADEKVDEIIETVAPIVHVDAVENVETTNEE